jgi:tetratricopeptide (TPR) repeat protein
MRRWLAALAVFTALLLASAIGVAQETEAQKHFETGRRLRDQGDYRGALVEFKEVLKSGESVGAHLNIGACHAALGEYRQAVDAYDRAIFAARSLSDQRGVDAADAAKRVRASEPWVMLRVKPEVADLADLRIVVDDVPVPREEFNGEIFRKTTTHVVKVSSADYEGTFKPENHGTLELRLDLLRRRAAASTTPPPPPVDHGWSIQKIAGVALMAGSVVPFALGVEYTILYLNHRSSLEDDYATLLPLCHRLNGEVSCTPATVAGPNGPVNVRQRIETDLPREYDDNEGKATLRQALAYGIGSAMLVGGLVLFLTAPPDTRASSLKLAPALGNRGSGISVVGSF